MGYTKIKGIYKITCNINGKVYIGRSVNIKVRWCRHRYDLRDGIHWNKGMQEDYNKYGLEAFSFETIYEALNDITNQELDDLERGFINQYNSYRDGYNETLGGTGNLGKSFTQTTRDRMGKSRVGKRHTEETVTKISTSKKKRLIINGELFLGMKDTARKLGICQETLLKRLRSEDYPEYQYEARSVNAERLAERRRA